MALIPTVIDYVSRLIAPLLNTVMIAVFTFFIGLIVGRIAGKLIRRALHAFEVDKTIAKATTLRFSVEGIAEVAVSYLIYVVFLIVALNQLGLTQWVLIVVSGLAGLIGLAALLLAVRDVLPNAVAGLIVMHRRFPKVADRVRIGDVEGRVVEVSLLEMRVKTRKGDLITFPNRQVLRSKVQLLSKK